MNENLTGRRIAFVSTYPPKQCGLATFSADLRASVPGNHPVIAVDDSKQDYPKEVRWVIYKHDRDGYAEAAKAVNDQCDAVCLQHEYGIYGGEDGEYVLDFLEELTVPAMVTCHTVLQRPSENQKRVLSDICALCSKVMVMSDRASDILEVIYGVSCDKIVVIPHGVPDAEGVTPAPEMKAYGSDPKLLTFGLLSPGKGIEVAIDGIAHLKENHPNVRYFVLGATHPELKRKEGEKYRDSLVAQVKRLGLEENVIFVDEYVDLPRLCTFLAGADVYVTPYLGKEQIVSGTLAYAVSFGLPIVSTPFVYAEELADKGSALLMPFQDSKRMAELVVHLLDDPNFRGRLRMSATTLGRTMRWPVIGQSLTKCFEGMVPIAKTSNLATRIAVI